MDLATVSGLAVFPCKATDKTPFTKNGFYAASKDPEQIRAWWTQYPGALVGVPTGQVNGIDVIDIDPRNGGHIWLKTHESVIPRTRTHSTRSGGVHLLFKNQGPLRCSAGTIAPGVDLRSDGVAMWIWWPTQQDEPITPWPTLIPTKRPWRPATAGRKTLRRRMILHPQGLTVTDLVTLHYSSCRTRQGWGVVTMKGSCRRLLAHVTASVPVYGGTECCGRRVSDHCGCGLGC